jgi:hypothetical protein
VGITTNGDEPGDEADDEAAEKYTLRADVGEAPNEKYEEFTTEAGVDLFPVKIRRGPVTRLRKII